MRPTGKCSTAKCPWLEVFHLNGILCQNWCGKLPRLWCLRNACTVPIHSFGRSPPAFDSKWFSDISTFFKFMQNWGARKQHSQWWQKCEDPRHYGGPWWMAFGPHSHLAEQSSLTRAQKIQNGDCDLQSDWVDWSCILKNSYCSTDKYIEYRFNMIQDPP